MAEVGRLVLDGSDAVEIEKVFEATGWPVRRFNPAITAISSKLPDGRVMRAYDEQFGIVAMHLQPEDRVKVKRYVARLA